MKREHILAVLYDLTLTIGGEVRLEGLLTKLLQRLLFHTSFPTGLVLLTDAASATTRLAAVVGDHALAPRIGQSVDLPAAWQTGEAEWLDDVQATPWLQAGSRPYRHVLKLPVEPEGLILLLSPEPPTSELPLTQVFRPVLRNLAKAIQLCRDSEQLTNRLITDRDQARSDLAAALQRSERERVFLRQLTNTLPDLVWLKDPDGTYLACNAAFERLFGASEADILGRTDRDFMPEALAQTFRDNDLAALAANAPRVNESWFGVAADGQRVLFETTKVPMRHADGRLLGVLGIAHDITQHRRDEEQLHLAASVFTHAREGIMITRADGLILEVNDTFTTISGYTREEVLGRNPRLLQSGVQGPEFYAGLWRALNTVGHWDGEVWNRRKNGELYPQLLTISAVRDEQGATSHFVALFSDISKIKEHERQLEHIAHFDALTGLPNRVLLADRLHHAMAQSHRRETLLAVAYLDLDGFKAINDQHGHAIGDRFLAGLAMRMKSVLREGDTLARLGGDEFAAVFLDLANEGESGQVLARLASAAAEPVKVDHLLLQATASIGVTFFPQTEAVDADQLLRQADQAMYQAKLAGKNRYHIFDPDQDRNARGHHESIERIRLALEAREFVLYFQPKVNMRTGAVVGAEALIRWRHPERGLLPPALFLPVIEDHHLSVDLGEWVVDSALAQMERWRAVGLDLPVSVNVGARQLQDPSFVKGLRRLLVAHPSIEPSRLELEVLETSALQDVRQVGQVLAACCQLGMTCALDDFGTGYSSLSYLKRLPAQVLKIDQSFVRDMLDDPDDLAILEGVLGLANAFHRQAIAEGVESVEHGVMLLQLGCELAQGYGIARPMPADDLPAWAAQWKPDLRWTQVVPVRPEDLPVLYAGVEHRAWVVALADFLAGKRNTPPQLDHQHCRFGEWLGQERHTARGQRHAFHEVEAAHQKVHVLAEELVALHSRDLANDALARLPELHALREELLARLDLLKRWPKKPPAHHSHAAPAEAVPTIA